MPSIGQTVRTCIALPVLLAATTTHAEKRRVRIGVQPIYALSIVDRRDPSGGGIGADVAFGLTDALSLRATGFVAWHRADGLATTTNDVTSTGPSGTMSSFGAFAGLSYSLDVLRIVPTFDLGVGVLGLRGDARFGDDATLLPTVNAFAVELGFSTDYLITRRWSAGFTVRYHALLTELKDAPSFLYVGPRVSLSLPY